MYLKIQITNLDLCHGVGIIIEMEAELDLLQLEQNSCIVQSLQYGLEFLLEVFFQTNSKVVSEDTNCMENMERF